MLCVRCCVVEMTQNVRSDEEAETTSPAAHQPEYQACMGTKHAWGTSLRGTTPITVAVTAVTRAFPCSGAAPSENNSVGHAITASKKKWVRNSQKGVCPVKDSRSVSCSYGIPYDLRTLLSLAHSARI